MDLYFGFPTTIPYEGVLEFFNDDSYDEEQKNEIMNALSEPSGLTEVLLLSDWLKQKYCLVNFTGTTNEQAIKKILTFYKHKTIRRGVGDHIFFEGFDMIDGKARISLGS
jgi:hypothetical protein